MQVIGVASLKIFRSMHGTGKVAGLKCLQVTGLAKIKASIMLIVKIAQIKI